jgi:hypothetical protein
LQEYINILRIRAEDVEHGLAQPTDPAFLVVVVRPLVPSDMADGPAAPALVDSSDLHHPSDLKRVRGRAMVNHARHWPRHGEGLVPIRPHVPPQRVQDVLV